MAIPDPQPGLVLSYAYLWRREWRGGRAEGRKDRPCVVISVNARPEGMLVRVAPVTHATPDDLAAALELPGAVKRHLGLDDARSWVIRDEVNEFIWPGFDLRPVPGARRAYAYGFLPPLLFARLLDRMRAVWAAGQGKASPRD